MNKLSLILAAGKHAVYLDKFVTTRYDSKMYVRNIGVYWKFKNVLKSANDSINTITGGVNIDPITFGEGYWSFNMISERLGESNIQLERNRHDITCKIRSAKQLNLLNFGPFLGFPANKVIQPNTWTNSPSNVDVNLGLRYVTIGCNCVDTDRNFDSNGMRSKVIATVPVTSEQSLNSSVTFYDNIRSEVSVLNGDHNMFEFDVNTNIGNEVGLAIMFEVYVEYIMKDSEILAEQGLRDIYYDPSGGYQSEERLYQKAKEKGLSVSTKMVREWLRTQDTYTRYNPIVKKHKYLKTFVKNLADQAQLDLVDMGKYGNKNKGYRCILTAVEILSRCAFTIPIYRKDTKNMTKAVDLLLENFKRRFEKYPNVVQFDEGKEFYNVGVMNLLKSHMT